MLFLANSSFAKAPHCYVTST